MTSIKSFDFSAMPPGVEVAGPTTGLYWLNTPKTEGIEQGKGLKVTPKPGSDYWRKTYTDPPADRASGHGLMYKTPADLKQWCVSTKFSLTLVDQFDQAGLLVYVDDHHWVKAGIEYEGGIPCMSCVVTNEESDWGYLPWTTSTDVQIQAKLQRYGSVLACEVEYMQDGKWMVLRSAPIFTGSTEAQVSVGVMCCAPKSEEGKPSMETIFHNMDIAKM